MGIFIAYLLGVLSGVQSKNDNRERFDAETQKDNRHRCSNSPISVVSLPPPKTEKEKADDRKNNRRRSVKFWVEVLSLITLAVYTGFTIAIFRASKRAADAAMRANAIATNYLIETEKANVTVGRSDGVPAEFTIPNDPKQDAQLVVYFQNSGRSPAKFNWGADSSLIATLPSDTHDTRNSADNFMKPPTILETEHVFQPMWRAKNRKTGELRWSGTIMIAGNSAYQGVLWEMPKERLIQVLNRNIPFVASGDFEFCDGFGNRVCRKFLLTHPRQFKNRLLLAFEDECPEWRMQATPIPPDSDRLPACVTPERREELKLAFPNLPKPE